VIHPANPFPLIQISSASTLEGVAIAAERIAAQNTLRRFLNQQNDKEQLATYQLKLMAAMVQFLVRCSSAWGYFRDNRLGPVVNEHRGVAGQA
jgi:hypothetical protein